MSGRRVAVLGATGLVGREMLLTLEQRNFPVSELVPLASERSEGKKVTFRGEEVTVRAVKEDSFKDVDIALFSAGGKTSKRCSDNGGPMREQGLPPSGGRPSFSIMPPG